MDMQYRILWLDDQVADLDGHVQFINQNLSLHGLELKIKWVDDFSSGSIKEITNTISQCAYDLIFVDYDLGKEKGDEILRRLRHFTHGEMIFYSGKPVSELRNMLLKLKIDGIFCLSRDKLGQEAFPIIKSSLRRILHPNYVRGLVVGVVSELEAAFSEIIIGLLRQDLMPEDEIRNELATSVTGYIEKLTSEAEEIKTKPIDRLIKKSNLHIKLNILLSLLEKEGSAVAIECHREISRFLDEVNVHRIEFAHAPTIEHNGAPAFKPRSGSVWDQRKMIEMIQTLRRYKIASSSAMSLFE